MSTLLFGEHLPRATAHLKQADPVLAALIERLPEPRLDAREDRFLALVRAIVNQQLSGRAAATIFARLLALFPDGLLPEPLAATAPERLREAGLSGAKARYLLALAQAVATGDLDLDGIDRLDDAQVIDSLVRLPGVGRWTAEMFLIFSLGRLDVLPVGDLGLRTAMRRHYALELLPDAATSQAIGAAWRPYASIATLYLWRSLDEG